MYVCMYRVLCTCVNICNYVYEGMCVRACVCECAQACACPCSVVNAHVGMDMCPRM